MESHSCSAASSSIQVAKSHSCSAVSSSTRVAKSYFGSAVSSSNGVALKHAAPQHKADLEIMLGSVKQNGDALKYISP